MIMFWGALATAAAPAVVNSITGLISNRNNRRHSVDMWKKQAEYNTPAKQMARLDAAGINPHLAFSSGNVNNVSQSQPAVMPLELGQMTTADMMTGANIDQTQANTELTATRNAIAQWDAKTAEAKATMEELNQFIMQGKLGNVRGSTTRYTQRTLDYIDDYAKRLREAEMSEMEARQLIGNMESELSKVNLTPQNAPLYKIAIEIFNRMGFDVDSLLN